MLDLTINATTDANPVAIDKTATNLATIAVDLNSGSDSGVSDSDDLTNDTTPTFNVTGLTAIGAVGDSLFLVIGTDTIPENWQLETQFRLPQLLCKSSTALFSNCC